MQLRTLITVSAALAPQLVKTQNITRWLEQQAKLPPCAVRPRCSQKAAFRGQRADKSASNPASTLDMSSVI